MGEIGCYTMDLYCDHPEHDAYSRYNRVPQYTGHTQGECLRAARREGWLINLRRAGTEGSGYALCPPCSGKKRSDRR
jgi:hypothetical protein